MEPLGPTFDKIFTPPERLQVSVVAAVEKIVEIARASQRNDMIHLPLPVIRLSHSRLELAFNIPSQNRMVAAECEARAGAPLKRHPGTSKGAAVHSI